jgi:probable DNA repair protein
VGAPLIQLLTPGTVLIAAGQRLGRHLAQQYARECRAAGREVWETPAILTLGAWLGELWQGAIETGAEARLLLTPAQEAALWERVISDSSRAAQMLSATATARLAHDAWTRMHEWDLPHSELSKAGHEDVQAFAAWAQTFDEICRSNRWLDSARSPNVLTDLMAQKLVAVPSRLIFAGFDEFTPQQWRLIETLRAGGSEVILHQPDDLSPAQPVRLASASTEQEIVAAAQWARARLDANLAARIGVLAPDLATHNRVIRRVFDDVLLPESVMPGHEEMARPYNVSLGEPLALQPLVGTAFAILEFAHGALPLVRLSELLRSPYLVGAEAEMTRRALLDVEIRRIGEVRVRLRSLARVLERATDKSYACPVFAQRLIDLIKASDKIKRVQTPSRWLAIIAQLLASLGWPGDRDRSSVEHQTIEAWRELLSEFGALDPVVSKIGYGEALARLRRLAQEKLFQRETPEAPVQILGVLEASGLEFDALWVMGLHDEVWPASPRPNPFLPIALQRARGLPHASAERELDFCARLTRRLLKSAPEVVLSHPQREEDRNLRPSPLIGMFPKADWVSTISAPIARYREVIHRQSRRETIIDERAPAVVEGTAVAGGTGLFKAQSACPFRGYAQFRLGARDFPEPEPGLSAADRGNLVHDLLTAIWQELASHAGLMAAGPDELAARVSEFASKEIEKLRYRRPETMTDRVAALEQERLVALTLDWLELERARAPFKVRREEGKTVLSVAGLNTPARMDRVDEMPDGSLVVIDYKTGEAREKDWFGERPAEPQVPLYALYGVPPESVTALFFASVRPGEPKFLGVARENGIAPGIGPYADTELAAQLGPWEELFGRWDATLVALAQEHRSGQARVSPRDKKVCENCHLHAFCRIYERRARLVDVGEGSDE